MTQLDEPNVRLIESSPILTGERVAFTGTLASMTHRQAMDLVEKHGGTAASHVSHQTTLMVVGEEGWPLEADGRVSMKLEQARQMTERGEPLRIVSESEWLTLLGVEPAERKTHQLYTPAMLSQLLGISVHQIRRWERDGLIRAVKKVFRLPYFNFQEVTGARRLTELAQSGVRLDELASGLERVRAVLPDLERPLAQLEILSRGKRIVIRNELGLIEPESGQRVFDFDPPEVRESDVDTIPFRSLDLSPPTFFSASHPQPHDHRHAWSATKWFQEGCRLSEENEVEAAIEAFRLALIDDPSNPAYHFHLADVLYREGCVPGAIERYYMTVELDHDFLEAWNQLGCLLAETGRVTSAIEAFQVALDLHSDFPDAHFHIAELLERSGKRADAIEHWRHYLRYDQRGPWADIARQKLGEDNEYS